VGSPSIVNELLDEIGRCDAAVRDSYTAGVQSVVDVVAALLSPLHPSATRTRAIGLFTLLVATLQLARAVSDPQLSDDILESGIRNAQMLLDCEEA
jgi:TetR/AcrR family transcriptional regulator, transcriptional repressor for nem operon